MQQSRRGEDERHRNAERHCKLCASEEATQCNLFWCKCHSVCQRFSLHWKEKSSSVWQPLIYLQAICQWHQEVLLQLSCVNRKMWIELQHVWGVSSVIWMVLHQQADNNLLHWAPSASFQLVKHLLFFFPLAAAVECTMDLELGFISNLWECYVQKNLASISDPFPELLLCFTHLWMIFLLLLWRSGFCWIQNSIPELSLCLTHLWMSFLLLFWRSRFCWNNNQLL